MCYLVAAEVGLFIRSFLFAVGNAGSMSWSRRQGSMDLPDVSQLVLYVLQNTEHKQVVCAFLQF